MLPGLKSIYRAVEQVPVVWKDFGLAPFVSELPFLQVCYPLVCELCIWIDYSGKFYICSKKRAPHNSTYSLDSQQLDWIWEPRGWHELLC